MTATVTITVNPVNDPPQAIGDTASVVAGVAKPVTVVNDTDTDGDVLTITGVTQGSKGTVVINGNTIVYTPNNKATPGLRSRTRSATVRHRRRQP